MMTLMTALSRRRTARAAGRRVALGALAGTLAGTLLGAPLVNAPLRAQVGGTAEMPGVNDRPNPYRTVEGWAKLPEGRAWGSTSAVAIDKDGVSV